MTKFTAAVVQASTVAGDTEATVRKAVDLIAETARRGAKVAVFPEAFIGGYPKGADFHIYLGGRTPEGRQEFAAYHASAINVPGPETDVIGKAARRPICLSPSVSSSVTAARFIAQRCISVTTDGCSASTAS
jgi:nitrilase